MLRHPLVYEIDTRGWLVELTAREGRRVTLANVPEMEFSRWQRLGFTHIWLMGVWTTGSLSRARALNNPSLRRRFDEILPHWREEEVPGSPYAISAYTVPNSLGGDSALAKFRARLNAAGLKLILDFVPNHVGLDHPWLSARPDLFVASSENTPGTFEAQTARGKRRLAHGRDPYFAPWEDVAQLDYRLPETQSAMIDDLASVAGRCDMARCDMAMLSLSDVFAKTWQAFPPAGNVAQGEFWTDAILRVKARHPGFQLLAEAYWDLEPQLLELGFDYAYDKTICDLVLNRRPAELQRRLLEEAPEPLAHGAHFLENHDERRAAATLTFAEHRAAALVILGLPGMRLLFHGQLEGAQVHTPVQLGRRPFEKANPDIQLLYERILLVFQQTAVGRGDYAILHPQAAWEGNPTAANFVVVQWWMSAAKFDLVVANLALHRGQCRVKLKMNAGALGRWAMRDLLGAETYELDGEELLTRGLHLDLPEYGAQLFQFEAKS